MSANVSVPVPADDEMDFWLLVSQESLSTIWDNQQDDVYAYLVHQ